MIWSYLISILRFFRRNKFFAAVNLLCLSAALTMIFIISIYVSHELSYDHFHPDADRLYRVSLESDLIASPIVMAPLGPALKQQMPEVEEFARLTYPFTRILQHGDRSYRFGKVMMADSTFFRLFSFKQLAGDRTTPLNQPYTIVLSKSAAVRLFSNKNPINRTVVLDGSIPLTVTGIIDDMPGNSHIEADALVSLSTMFAEGVFHRDNWNGGFNYYTYLKLARSKAVHTLESKLPGFAETMIDPRFNRPGTSTSLLLEPVTSIHLYSESPYEIKPADAIDEVIIFSGIGLIILLIAGVNYVILATAFGSKRAREIGVRRSLGATRLQVGKQFLGEAYVLIAVSLLISVIGLKLAAPYFEPYLGVSLQVSRLLSVEILVSIILLSLLLGLAAGAYTAVSLTRAGIPEMFRKRFTLAPGKFGTRNVLLVFQFVLAGLVIFGTLTIFNQYRYMIRKPIGLETGNRMVIDLPNEEVRLQKELLVSRFQQVVGIGEASTMSSIPFGGVTSNGYIPEGEEEPVMLNQIDIDQHFFNVFGLSLVEGRTFPENPERSETKCIINESAARMLGWDDPVSRTLVRNGIPYEIIGVVRDFHFNSLHHKIEPLILRQYSGLQHYDLVLEITSGDVVSVVDDVRNAWNSVLGAQPFYYQFYGDQLAAQYREEEELFRSFSAFALIAIVLSVTGLMSVVAYTITRKMKEIGIRKVFGATGRDVLTYFYRIFIIYLAVGFVFTAVIGTAVANVWYATLPYKVGLTFSTYLLTGLLIIVFPSAVIYIQVRKAASVNPVETIRKE